MRGRGRHEEESKEPLEEPVPTTVGRRGGRRRKGSNEAGGAVGSRGSARDVKERRDGDAEGGEEEGAFAPAAPGGGAERRELPQLPLVHGLRGAALVQHPGDLAREAGEVSVAGASDGRGGRHGCAGAGRKMGDLGVGKGRI